ncbi:MAG: class I SAM-dependent methyltransferase [Ignavibacteria bacterium]|nr:class I SAM-dependent methyltransferase [Ignavibacteria bacterium]
MTPNDNLRPDLAPKAPLCILCGADATNRILYPGILKCPSCGLVFADTHISPDEVRQLYRQSYFFGDEYLNYLEDKPFLQENFSARLRTIRKFSDSGNLFEIGCAYGFFLDLARHHWNSEGCDISAQACSYAQQQGLNAVCSEFLDLSRTENHYDVVALWDTIEHLSRPDRYIEKGARLLKNGGVLCITTGDIGSTMARMRKRRWRLIHPPTHLYYFDRLTMEKLLLKNGLDVVHFEHCGYSRSVQQMLYSLLVLNRETPLRKSIYAVLKPLFAFSLYLNLFDIMFVIARKK